MLVKCLTYIRYSRHSTASAAQAIHIRICPFNFLGYVATEYMNYTHKTELLYLCEDLAFLFCDHLLHSRALAVHLPSAYVLRLIGLL